MAAVPRIRGQLPDVDGPMNGEQGLTACSSDIQVTWTEANEQKNLVMWAKALEAL